MGIRSVLRPSVLVNEVTLVGSEIVPIDNIILHESRTISKFEWELEEETKHLNLHSSLPKM